MWKDYKYLHLAQEMKKLWNMKVTIIPIVICTFGAVPKELIKGLKDLEIRRRVETIQTNYIIEIVPNTEKSPGDLISLAVIQTPVKRPSANADVKNLRSK